ncbi:2-dehydro-3-deoxyphosphogluconate aldolase/4-hydroxy-2-oxoglutarate aldolase [Chondrocystis sp. NIES-4102]|nr:2-dehydro-3-deoxyphosphogluconate aldolase/4-hydroxy-2-oxoglutarate aldolase [Chondrocystis sp. NIES-4102]
MILDAWVELLQEHKAIAVIRSAEIELAYQMAKAVAAGGINLIEVTWNSDRPGDLVTQLRSELPDCIIGAGTILTLDQLQLACSAGAQFAFSPHFDPQLLAASINDYHIPYVPGVLSPTEIVNAWQQGAKVVKIFPIKSLGGAEYLQCLKSPLNQINFIPTGGITIDNAQAMIKAGAIAVGISSNLFPHTAIANRNWWEITTKTQDLIRKLNSIDP